MISNNDKICIVCRKMKSSFSEEHVIPATLGGGFVIDTVCRGCNQLLGDVIDTSFVNHKQILVYRHQFGLSRQGRSVKNPLSGVFKDSEGNAFIVAKGDQTFTGEYLPKMTISEGEHGLMGIVTVSAKLMENDPNFLEKYKQKFKVETGFDVNYYTEERYMPVQGLTAETKDSDNKIILGCLKMVYEFCVACIPEYFEDDIALGISEMLLKGSINHDLAQYLVPKFSLRPVIEENLERFPELSENHIIIVIEQVDGYGLIACVKLFEKFLTFKLSAREDYLDERILLLANNSETQKARCTFLKDAHSVSLNFTNSADSGQPVIDPDVPIRMQNLEGTASFIIDERSTVPVYRNMDYKAISKANKIEDFSEGLFIKCSKTGKLFALKSVAFNYN